MLRLRSIGIFMRQPLVRLPVLLVTTLALWLGAELAAFAAVVHFIGFAGAILACLLTSLAGLTTLRRAGPTAVLRLRQAVAGRASEHPGLSREAAVDGTLTVLGAVLLILPGFVSDLAGLALAAPSVRIWLTGRLKLGKFEGPGNSRPTAPSIIELAPREWSRHDGPLP